jgi:hypothetical protein
MRSVCLIALVICLPANMQAQQEHGSDHQVRMSAGAFGGIGSGPSSSAVLGVEGMIPIWRRVAVRGEFSSWHSGVGVDCVQSWPESYACSVGGWALLGGLRASLPLNQRMTPFVDLAGGRFSRDRVAAASYGSAVISGSVGISVQLSRVLAARLSGAVLRPLDEDYEELMGEHLGYSMAVLGLEYRRMR